MFLQGTYVTWSVLHHTLANKYREKEQQGQYSPECSPNEGLVNGVMRNHERALLVSD